MNLATSHGYTPYGYVFNNPYENATIILELWDASFEGLHMNSRNHYVYASVNAWFYSHLAGIDLEWYRKRKSVWCKN